MPGRPRRSRDERQPGAAVDNPSVDVALLGLGLIGGSVARDLGLARAGDPTIRLRAWSPTGRGPRAARAAGVIDDAPDRAAQAVAGADIVVLAGPPPAVLGLVDRLGHEGDLGPDLAPTATVTDVASTKQLIDERADRARLRFVGGHPMAGLEASGWSAAVAGLFRDRPWVVVPGAHSGIADVERVEWLAGACGAIPIPMTAAAHDAAVAAISHLPLLLAAALAESVAGRADGARDEALLAAGGWSSMTRLAAGEPAMGAGILATNAGPVAVELRAIRRVLDAWLAELEARPVPDGTILETRLARVRDQLRAFDTGRAG